MAQSNVGEFSHTTMVILYSGVIYPLNMVIYHDLPTKDGDLLIEASDFL